MKFEIDDKVFAKELAEYAYSGIRRYLEERQEYMFYDEDIAKAVQSNINKLFEENKDKILDRIVEHCAEQYHKDIKLQVILSAMMNKGD